MYKILVVDDDEAIVSLVYQEAMLPEYELNSDISYEEFQKLMKEADEIIGGGSKYAARNLIRNFSRIPMTYEDAL